MLRVLFALGAIAGANQFVFVLNFVFGRDIVSAAADNTNHAKFNNRLFL